MKIPTVISLVHAALASMVVCNAAPQMRDAATNDDLANRYKKSVSENPLRKMEQKPREGPDPTKVNQPEDLIKTSDFISFQDLTTLVPKRAIIHIPKNYQARIKFVPGTKIVTWADFYVANRGWVKTMEVTRAQAEGNEPFDEKVIEGIQKSSQLVVATYKGGPISVLPPKKPEDETKAADPKTADPKAADPKKAAPAKTKP